MIIAEKLLNTEQIKSFNTLDTVFKMDRNEAAEMFSPYFVKYHSRLFRERGYLNCILNHVKWWSEILNIENKKVLDIGCGFGVYTLLFSFFGASEIFGADHNEEKIQMFNKILSIINPPLDNVKPSLQDGLEINFGKSSFPIIFIKDVISHVRSLDPFLSEISRLLEPGGKVLITDENNALEFKGKKERREKWTAWESEGISTEDVRAGEPLMTYRAMRKEITRDFLNGKKLKQYQGISTIRENFQDNDIERDILISILSEETQGFWGDELIDAIKELLSTGELKTKPEFSFRHPKTGEFMEREFNPFWLAKRMSKFNLKSRVIRPRYFTQKPLLNVAGRITTYTHPLSVFLQPNFYILGYKQKTNIT